MPLKVRSVEDDAEPAKAFAGSRMQYAALPYRVRDELELLLITSRQSGRWVVPKGWPMKGKAPYTAAAREAVQEAGVEGRIAREPVGSFHYEKRLADGATCLCTVKVFPLAVERERKRWREMDQRNVRWFRAREAAACVDEPELAALITAFAAGYED